MKTTILFASLISLATVATFATTDVSAQQRRVLGTVNVNPPPKPYSGQQAIDLLALETDLTPRQVRMIVRHNPAVNYTFMSEIKTDHQFRQVLGEARTTAYFNGEPIELYSDKARDAARAMTAQQSSRSIDGIRLAVAVSGH